MTEPRLNYHRLANDRLGLRSLRKGSAGGASLLCIPYAGGQSLAFKALAEHVPQHWNVWAIDPPGHGWAAGPPLDRVEEMSLAYFEHLPRELTTDVVLLGHSLGGCVGLSLATRLHSAGLRPRGVVLSGTRPPHRRADYESFLEMDDQTLLDSLIRIGGVPAEWAGEPEVFAQFKESLRADFRAFEAFQVESRFTAAPVLAVGGLDDEVCRPEHVFEWARLCPGCQIDFVNGRHLFLQTEPAQLAQRLVRFVKGLNGSPSRATGGKSSP